MPEGSSGPPEFDPLVVEPTGAVGRTLRGRNRAVVVALGVAVVAVAVPLVLSIVDRSPEEAIDQPRSTPSSVPVSTAPGVSLAPVVTTHPFGWTVIDATDLVPTFSADAVVEGWTEWSLPAPTVVDGLDSPTEVVVLTAGGVLHRIELPTGVVRSRSVPDVSTDGQIALAADAIAVPKSSGVAVVADDGSVATAVDRTREVPRVVRLGALDRFLVIGGRAGVGEPEQQWLVDVDGAITELADGPFASADPWDRQFLPTGELLVGASGAVDAVDVDGTVRRIAEGAVVATGRNHYAIRRCDQACEYTVVDVVTGERTAANLRVLDKYRYWDTAAHLSPDGRYLQFADWQRIQTNSLLVSVADGRVVNSWPTRSIRTPDTWAPGSYGAFGTTGESLAFYTVDGRVTVIDGLGPIRSAATRPLG